MVFRSLSAALAAFAAFQTATAQTWTYCNPMNETCPNDIALGSSVGLDMSQKLNPKVWNITAGPMNYGGDGAEFTIKQQGQSPTIQSNFHIMWGRVDVVMRVASGTGIISSIVLQSDDLDEIDWEFMGGNKTHVQTNFFGKGNTTSFDRGGYHDLGFVPQDGFHNYSVTWTKENIQWWADNKLLRTLDYAGKGTIGGQNYPQTPCDVRLGIWAGGDPKQPKGVIEWAGGITDFKDTYTMYVKSVNVTDFTTGAKEYEWTDKTGSYQSIKAIQGNSTILQEINKPPGGITNVWNRLTAGAKSGIVIGAVAGLGVVIAGLLVCCIIQGRKGRKEKAIADAKYDKEQAEFNAYRMQMMNGGFGGNGAQAPTYGGYRHDGKEGRF